MAARAVGQLQQDRRRALSGGSTRGGTRKLSEKLAIRQRLVDSDKDNAEWQLDLSIDYDRIANLLAAAGKREEALALYQKSLAIRQRLADGDKGNVQLLRALVISFRNVGDMLDGTTRTEDALAAYQQSLANAQELVRSDAGVVQWQRDLALTLLRIADVLRDSGKLKEVLDDYRQIVAIYQRLVAADRNNTPWQESLQIGIGRIGGIAYNFVLARNFAEALEAGDQAIALAPDKIWLYRNRAHALMFLDRVDEARALYLKYRGQQNVFGNKSWEIGILEGFALLQKAGLTHPLMHEIEKQFAGT
jgi:tetratricopeptide (TPR) repeat protein